MVQQIKLFIIDKNHYDQEIELWSSLNSESLHLEYELIDTPESFLKRFDEFNPDLIIVSNDNSQFDSSDVLKLIKSKSIAVPCIISTDSFHEQDAVTSLKVGATDYFLRDHPIAYEKILEKILKQKNASLKPISTQTELSPNQSDLIKLISENTLKLQEANQKLNAEINQRAQLERLLVDSEKLHRTIVESANSIIMRWESSGLITFINTFATHFFGYDNNDLIGKNVSTLFPDNPPMNLPTLIDEMQKDPDHFTNMETINIQKNGSQVWVAYTNRVIKNDQGQVVEILSVGNDITQKKVAEALLLQKEWQYRTLLENSPDIIIRFDKDGRPIYSNAAMQRLTGLSADHFIDYCAEKTIWSPPKFQSRWKYELEMVFKSGKGQVLDFGLKRDENAEFKYFQAKMVPEFSDEHHVSTVLAIIRDLTDKHKFETALKESEANYRLLFKSNPQPMWVFDFNTRFFLAVNTAMINQYGYSEKEFLSMTIQQICADKENHSGSTEFKNLENARDTEVICYHKKKNGELFQVEITSHSITFKNQPAVIALANNVTEREITLRELAQARENAEKQSHEAEASRRILEALMEYIPEGIIIANASDFKIQLISKYGKSLGFSDPETTPPPIQNQNGQWKFLHIDHVTHPTPDELPINRAIKLGEIITDEEWVLRENSGKEYIISVSAGPIRYNSTITGAVVSWRDTTSRKNAQEQIQYHSEQLAIANRELRAINIELDKANDRLKNQDKSKSEFVSMASHELRTPLTGIIGLTQTLLTPELEITTQEREKFLKMIEGEGKRLAFLLGELLDLTKIETGVYEIKMNPIDISAFVHETLGIFKVPKEISVSVDLPKKQLLALGDPDRIKQVLINLLDNASRYAGTNGTITISAHPLEKFIQIDVKDSGPGIRTDELQKVFDKFYRGKQQTNRKDKGSGLGLTISKKIIEAHGGTIWAESVPDKGSTFSFTLPKGQTNDHKSSHY